MKRNLFFIKLVVLLFSIFMHSCEKKTTEKALELPQEMNWVFETTTNSIKAEWAAVEGATSYTVELKNETEETIFTYQLLEPNILFSGLLSGTKYYVRTKANIGEPQYDSPFTVYQPIATKLAAPVPTLIFSDESTLTFSWPAQSSATGYYVELSTESGTIVKEGQTSDPEYTFEGLDENVNYKFRVKAKNEYADSDFSNSVSAITVSVAEGFPVSWVFAEANTQKDYLNKTLDPAALQAQQPQWLTTNEMKSESLNGYNKDAKISVVSPSGSVNGFAYNNGHPYLKGLMYNDYWLYTIPVKNFKANTTLTLQTNVAASGSGPGPMIIEWSTDNMNWTAAGAKTANILNGSSSVAVTYSFYQGDNLNATGQPIKQDITISKAVDEGNIYIRLRVAANIRVTPNGSGIATGGSTRLMSRQLIVIKD